MDHIIDVEDNFWDIGAGPYGPHDEIFYDPGEAYNDPAEDDHENYHRWGKMNDTQKSGILFFLNSTTNQIIHLNHCHKNIDTEMGS